MSEHICKDNVQELLDQYFDDERLAFEEQHNDILETNGMSELPDRVPDAIKIIEELQLTDHIVYNWLKLKKDLAIK